jgi:hypothetical protein
VTQLGRFPSFCLEGLSKATKSASQDSWCVASVRPRKAIESTCEVGTGLTTSTMKWRTRNKEESSQFIFIVRRIAT